MALRKSKNLLRKQIKTAVSELSNADKASQSRAVCRKLLKTTDYAKSSRISIFLSMDDEIQVTDILNHMFEANKTVYIPWYEKTSNKMDMLRLYSLDDYENLPTTDWNIKQPLKSDSREEALSNGGLDLILVPGLAFTLGGKRLGRGRGYYDTYLERCFNAFKDGKIDVKPKMIGLAFNEQICDNVPVDERDFILDMVISEKHS